MKILLLSHTGLVTGGAEQCLLEYVDVLMREGHKCKVIVPYKGAMTKAFSEKGIAWTVVGYGWATIPHRKVHPHRILASTGHSLVKIFQEVEKFKPDIIVTNTSVIPWGLYAGRAFNIPTVLLVHEILNDKDPSLKMAPNYREYGEILNNNTDYVVYNSKFVKGEFKNVLTLPKISKDILYPLPPLDQSKVDHFYKENIISSKVKIAIFGALSPRKNQLESLRAAKILLDQGVNNFSIDLYGDMAASASYTKELRRFIRANSLGTIIKIKGYTTNVYQTMNEYNAVLSTATYEPFGRSIIEGQLFGKIVIANNTGGGSELVKDMDTGLVYEFGNHEQLAEKIKWVMDNQSQALALGVKAKTVQFGKYLTPTRYDALLDAIKYCGNNKDISGVKNIFEPLMSLFQYNHQLNSKYKNLYRITHNKIINPIRGVVARILGKTKRVVRKYI